MRLAKQEDNKLSVVTLSGSVTGSHTHTLRSELLALVSNNENGRVVVNLGGVREMDSFTLGALVAVNVAAKKHNVSFVLAEVRGRWSKFLRIAQLDTVITTYTTMSSAMNTLNVEPAIAA
ncbi:MAG: STAS domain-containing protein [Candidatus Poribacteria bacterium]|nr:STAS domain-containing protein [Candidatus Poribacteria bacterium]